jgi:uncharacterized membrane protein YfcA
MLKARSSLLTRVPHYNHRNSCLKGVRWHATNKQEDRLVIPKAFFIGTLAGLGGSLAGMGGGFVMIPMMTSSLLRLSQHQAHGTSLFAVAATGIAGGLSYFGEVQYESAAAISACGMITARMGASVTAKLSEKLLKKALGTFMLCVAPLVPAKAYLLDTDKTKLLNDTEQPEERPPLLQRLIVPATIGLFSGFLAGVFGVGGGAIIVPVLTIATDMNHYEALGTSLCAMSLPAMVGTATHYSAGNVAMRVAPALALGAFAGAFFGGKLGLQTNENALRFGFSGLMVFLGTRMLIK